MSIVRNDIYYQSLQKSLSKKMLCVQKLSKYFTVSTEAAIQITSHICCIFFKKCQSKPNIAFRLCLIQCQLLGSNLHVFLTTVIWPRMNSAVSKLVANLIYVIKGPCVIWCASKRSMLHLTGKVVKCSYFAKPNSSFHLPFKGNVFVNYHWIMLGLICRLYPMSQVNLALSKPLRLTMEILSPCKVYYVLLLSKGEESEYHVQGSRWRLGQNMQSKNSFLPYPGNIKLTIVVLSLWDENSPFTISFLKGRTNR